MVVNSRKLLISCNYLFLERKENDTITVMNAQSSGVIDDLKFYVVAADWMHRAWPHLTMVWQKQQNEVEPPYYDENWRDAVVGKVKNAGLLVQNDDEQKQSAENLSASSASGAVSDEEDNRSIRQGQKKSLMLNELSLLSRKRTQRQDTLCGHQQKQPAKVAVSASASELSRKLTHQKDYFLLGMSAWALVKSKFGCDVEIPLTCSLDKDSAGRGEIFVVLHPAQYKILVPSTGRFGYERILDKACVTGSSSPLNKVTVLQQHRPLNVSDDEGPVDGGDDLVRNFLLPLKTVNYLHELIAQTFINFHLFPSSLFAYLASTVSWYGR